MAASSGPAVSHLLFADDCILLGRASLHNAVSFASIIQCYCHVSGQKINVDKSMICFSPKTPRTSRIAIHQALGIFKKTDELSYLGIPLLGRRPRIRDYTTLERRIRDRLDGWQVTGLSMMARITLIRSVLSSLPMYLLSNAAVPVTCLRRIERCFRDFLWASRQDGHGMHLLAWESICMPLSEGGLGIQSLIERREALLARHASRFILDPQCLWSSFMRARYGVWSTSMDLLPTRGHSFFWKEVCRHAPTILNNVSWVIGDGSSVNVAHDIWISDLSLSRWPSFISTDVPPGMLVRELITQVPFSWDISTVTRLFGDELARRILSIPIIPGPTPDTRLWRRSCLARAPLTDLIKEYRTQPQELRDAAWIWKLPIHPRVQLFIWKILWNCLPSCSLLSRRGLPVVATCPLCGVEEETTGHAILTCPRWRWIWLRVGYTCRVDGSGSSCVPFLDDLRGSSRQRSILWATTAYHIWLSRNQFIFADDPISPHRLEQKIRSMVTESALLINGIDFRNPGPWGSPAAAAANRRTVFISWEPPPPGFVKINFDGSVRGRLAGSAFVIRGPDGALLSAGGFGSLDFSVPMAELYAVWAGISHAVRRLHAHSLFIEGDSLSVVRWLQAGVSDHTSSNPLLRDIWSILSQSCRVHIRHIYREANSAADWVAAAVAHHSGFWICNQGDPCPVALK